MNARFSLPTRLTWWHDCALILLFTALPALIIYLSGADNTIATWAYQPESTWAWFMRNITVDIVYGGVILAFIILFIAPLRRRFPAWRQLATVWLLSLIFGLGLINQVLLQEMVERPRPRETVLVDNTSHIAGTAHIKGKSFPSGHAALGFLLAIPFFIWRHDKPWLARTWLGVGILAGLYIGYGRMVLGGHFLSDVIIAGTIILICGAVFSRMITRQRDIPSWIWGLILFLTTSAIILGNNFSVQLSYQPVTDTPQTYVLKLPCSVTQVAGDTFTLTVDIEGFGAPETTLALTAHNGTISLNRWRGIYHSIKCTAQATVPPGYSITE